MVWLQKWGPVGLVTVAIVVFLLIWLRTVTFWLWAIWRGGLTLRDMAIIHFLKTDVRKLVRCAIRLHGEGLDVPIRDMEAHDLSGGRVDQVTEAVILIHQAGHEADWRLLMTLDLAGHDVVVFTVRALEDGLPVDWETFCAFDGSDVEADLSSAN